MWYTPVIKLAGTNLTWWRLSCCHLKPSFSQTRHTPSHRSFAPQCHDRWEIIARAEIEIINNKGSCTKLWLASWASNTIVVQPCFNIIILRQGLINVQVVILKVSYYAQAYSKSHAVSNMHDHIPMTWLISTITQQEYIVADMHNHTARVYCG